MERPARWLLPEEQPEHIDGFARALGVCPPAARVLWSRGYRDARSAEAFLRPRIEHLTDPFGMRDMDRAVERLADAISRREKILLYGDYDVDGTVSVVVLRAALALAGIDAEFFVPHRMRDGYGMRAEVIDAAAERGIGLIVSVDTGIRAGSVVAHARERGIDVIVTDHHLPESELPPAYAVVNPHRSDCGYSQKDLCGAGVTFKLVHALMQRLGWAAPRIERVLLSMLKLVAIATVADVVPLTGENRVIVKLGLDGLRDVNNHGLRALLEVAGIAPGDVPAAGQVAFQIAPRINAAGRMADAADVVRMFLTRDEEQARAIARQLNELNQDRQQTEADIVQAIVDECERVPVTDAQAALVFSGPCWHKGVVGIVASRVVDRFYRPAFVLCEETETGLVQGSGRSVPGFHLLEALESMAELFTRFGGHKQAAGVTLPIGALAEFRERLNDYARGRLSPEDFRPTVEVDAELTLAELNERNADDILALGPFGYGNPEPVFLVRDAELSGPPRVVDDRQIAVALRQNGRSMVLRAWRLGPSAAELPSGSRVDAAIVIQNDAWTRRRGFGGWRPVLKQVRVAAAAAGAQ
ncbi:MAG TPA: single-stranded-DNA-specific exonuclease RecJ [Bryobacteraceae bacterium]|nr:single-stranded-DNA-specific exonuclease RecJ [Bryobacteraceae bacterium]